MIWSSPHPGNCTAGPTLAALLPLRLLPNRAMVSDDGMASEVWMLESADGRGVCNDLYAMLGRCATNSRYVMNGEQRREASELERCHRRLGATRQEIHGCCCCCCCSLINLSLSPTPSPDPAQQLSFTSEANDSTARNRTGTRLKRVRHGRNG